MNVSFHPPEINTPLNKNCLMYYALSTLSTQSFIKKTIFLITCTLLSYKFQKEIIIFVPPYIYYIHKLQTLLLFIDQAIKFQAKLHDNYPSTISRF